MAEPTDLPNPTPPPTPPGDPVPPNPPPVVGAVVPAAAPPPAARIVAEGPKGEGDAAEAVELRRQLSQEREDRKKEQIRAAELEDENHRLKGAGAVPPAGKKKSAATSGNFLFD